MPVVQKEMHRRDLPRRVKNHHTDRFQRGGIAIDEAWLAAAANPTAGVAYTFPLLTTGIEPGSQIRLVAGRSTNDPQSPATTADDVIIADERWLATTTVDADGHVEFSPLGVATGTWSSGSDTVPSDLLYGTTVIAARAFEPGNGDIPAYRFLATAFFLAVTPRE